MIKAFPKQIKIPNTQEVKKIITVADVPVGHVFKAHDLWPLYLKTNMDRYVIVGSEDGTLVDSFHPGVENNSGLPNDTAITPKSEVYWYSSHRLNIVLDRQ